jgi:hypothetical protein
LWTFRSDTFTGAISAGTFDGSSAPFLHISSEQFGQFSLGNDGTISVSLFSFINFNIFLSDDHIHHISQQNSVKVADLAVSIISFVLDWDQSVEVNFDFTVVSNSSQSRSNFGIGNSGMRFTIGDQQNSSFSATGRPLVVIHLFFQSFNSVVQI